MLGNPQLPKRRSFSGQVSKEKKWGMQSAQQETLLTVFKKGWARVIERSQLQTLCLLTHREMPFSFKDPWFVKSAPTGREIHRWSFARSTELMVSSFFIWQTSPFTLLLAVLHLRPLQHRKAQFPDLRNLQLSPRRICPVLLHHLATQRGPGPASQERERRKSLLLLRALHRRGRLRMEQYIIRVQLRMRKPNKHEVPSRTPKRTLITGDEKELPLMRRRKWKKPRSILSHSPLTLESLVLKSVLPLRLKIRRNLRGRKRNTN